MKQVIAIVLAGLASGMMIQTVEAQVPITSNEAKNVALKHVRGKIVNIGLEHEDGKLVYDVDMRTNLAPIEVIIDAKSGKVMEIKKEIEQ
jgi:uncharacterized membrane protein YkoI